MDGALALAGFAMGVAATPHCVAMCAAPCAAIGAGRRDALGFQAARLVGYATAGAVAASSVSALAAAGEAAPVLRPLWLLLHLAFFAFGLWLLVAGREPALPGFGRRPGTTGRDGGVPVRIVPRRGALWGALRAPLAGLAWVAWPCGVLQAALLLAALANGPSGGAMVMAAFAVGSMPALAAAPWLFGRLGLAGGRGGASAAAGGKVSAWGLRLAGLGIVAASGWALSHGLWERFAAWCAS